MLMLLGIAGAALGYYGWRAVQVHAPTDHPALEVKATCQTGSGPLPPKAVSGRPQDLRLRGGEMALRLQAGAHPTRVLRSRARVEATTRGE